MKADTVELLYAKARFTIEQALAIAEAIEMAIADSQPVTVPVLDARLAAFEHRFAAFEARIDQKFDRFRLQMIIAIVAGNAALGPLGAAVLDAIRRAL